MMIPTCPHSVFSTHHRSIQLRVYYVRNRNDSFLMVDILIFCAQMSKQQINLMCGIHVPLLSRHSRELITLWCDRLSNACYCDKQFTACLLTACRCYTERLHVLLIQKTHHMPLTCCSPVIFGTYCSHHSV